MADVERIAAYAEALLGVASAEGTLKEVEDELFRFSRVIAGNDELRTTLTDANIPTSRRQQIIEDLLGDKASPSTVALLVMVIGLGRARDIPAIIEQLVELSAAAANREVAEVRVAVELTDDQRTRLAAALEQTLGKRVEVKVIVDPDVLGGIVTQVGDTVIDGSIKSRLEKLKNKF
jgi:F-type H+-transporting ATPase subunit delta